MYCRTCVPCSTYHRGVAPKQGRLLDMRVGEPMQRLQIDLSGPFPRSRDGMVYIMTAVCAFTKYAVAVALPNKSASTVAHALVHEVILRIGCPSTIHSGLGKEFQNSLLAKICDELGIERSHTTPYHSRGNGGVERLHRSLNSMLGKVVASHQTDWPDHLAFVVNAYNVTEHSSTGFSPFFLMHGREQQMPIDVILGDTKPPAQQVNDFAQSLIDRMRQAHAMARDHLKRSGERVKRYYDAKVKSKDFKVNDRVWMLNPRRFCKRSPKWERPYIGPFTIVKKINDVNFLLKRGSNAAPIVTHVDKLRKCANAMFVVCSTMRFKCPACTYGTDRLQNITRHTVSQHEADWRGAGRPLDPIPPHLLAQRMIQHRLKNRNSKQRRRDRERAQGLRPPRAQRGAPTLATLHLGGDIDDPGSNAPVHVAPTSAARPAGPSGTVLSFSSIEFPELADGGLVDLDVDPSPWWAGDDPDPEQPVLEAPSSSSSGWEAAARAREHLAAFVSRRQTRDVAVGSDDAPSFQNEGTQMDPEIRAGPPCGVDAQGLADAISQNPGLGPSFIAEWLAQRPIDQEELQVLRWAAQTAVRVEQNTAQAIIHQSAGVWANTRNQSSSGVYIHETSPPQPPVAFCGVDCFCRVTASAGLLLYDGPAVPGLIRGNSE